MEALTLKGRALAALAADCVVFGYDDEGLFLALIERKNPPFKGSWALPGGFVEEDETLEAAARRELAEETTICGVFLEPFGFFDAVDRDPRGRVVAAAFYALVNFSRHRLRAREDAAQASWWPIEELPELAFDHQQIIAAARRTLVEQVRRRPIGMELLPETFTLTQLQVLYERIMGRTLDKRNFRRKLSGWNFVVDTGVLTKGGRQRPARLFQFDHEKYQAYSNSGLHFDL